MDSDNRKTRPHEMTGTLNPLRRQYVVGAELAGDGLVSVRVWAPDRKRVTVVMDGHDTMLDPDPDGFPGVISDGYFRGLAKGQAGSRYGFRLDDDTRLYADPASRSQPDGPHGLSEIVDPSSYAWQDARWPGISLQGQVLYELHVGTFTPDGTWATAIPHLERLHALGITTIQMMPVADFPGEFGWGYDGVNWFAPTRLYGRPDDLRAFIDAAHQHGLGVILDAVYNHLGPDGNYLSRFGRDYFTERYSNEWGEAINFDGPRAFGARELVLANVEHWIREYHFDGFRLDATQQIFDASDDHVLAALVTRARHAAGDRRIVIIAENEAQDARLARPAAVGGYGLDALYNDDFHHSARVALTGIREAYYSDYRGTSQELLSAAVRGFLFQGQRFRWHGKNRGTPALDLVPRQFICFLENHDQVANSTTGERMCELSAPGQLRALTALLLLGPGTPLLFQGQESGSTSPFMYFAHHEGDLGAGVRRGRLEFLGQFTRFEATSSAARELDPTARSTFEACRLPHEPTGRAQRLWRLHADLLRLRRADTTIALQGAGGLAGATLDERALVLRFFSSKGAPDGDDRLLVVNLGAEIDLATVAEPLVAPPVRPAGASWTVLWSSEAVAYGGGGTPPWQPDRWPVPGHAALLLAPEDDQC
jgi:maltooligosyltrehalose trehalohydrolase